MGKIELVLVVVIVSAVIASSWFLVLDSQKNQIPVKLNETTLSSGDLVLVRNYDYERMYCDKINPNDSDVRKAASDAVKSHPGGYSWNQMLDIYDWVKTHIGYINIAVDISPPSQPSKTLYTKSGDSKNQAVLIASMIESIGGNSKVILDPVCKHAYAIVFAGYTNQSIQPIVDSISEHYNRQMDVNWLALGNENWLIFDPAGGSYPGNTISDCSGNRTLYEVNSCVQP